MSDDFKCMSNPIGRHLTVSSTKSVYSSVQKTFTSSHWKVEAPCIRYPVFGHLGH